MDAIDAACMTRLDLESQKYIKSIDLMESAGASMADIIMSLNPKNVLIILGSGGNAGDGLVVGRYLLLNGINTTIYKISEIKNEDSKINLLKYKGKEINDLNNISEYDLIVDAILGNGLNKPLKDNYIDVINIVNRSNAYKVSLDVPSGINSSNGLSMGAFVKANLTITVEYPKLGFFLNDGLEAVSELKIVKCGMNKTDELIHINEIDDFKDIIPLRHRNTNKSSFGRASIVAGSYNYPGASLISYNALLSFMMGVGYSRLYVPKRLYEIYALKYPEIIVDDIQDNDGFIKYSKDDLDKILKSSDSISIGMGMGVSEDLYKSIDYLIKSFDKKIIIDADGINSIAKYGVDILNNHKADIILTPHPKEFSRLTGLGVNEILENPVKYATDFSKKYNVTLILKGASSVITDGVNTAISIFGSTGLAKGGSGDALSGILAGSAAYIKKTAFDVSSFACFMLGYSAQISNIPYESVRISDIIKEVPNTWKMLEMKK